MMIKVEIEIPITIRVMYDRYGTYYAKAEIPDEQTILNDPLVAEAINADLEEARND